MRLTPARVAALPLATAIVDPAGEVIAWSPEWQGAGLGTVTYAAGSSTLLVNPVDQSGSAGELVAALLGELAAAETVSAPGTGRQLRLLGAALRLVVGRRPDGVGTVADVLADLAALAALHPTCPVAVEPTPRPDVAVAGPATVAMALGQLVRNAVQHDGATSIRLMVADGPTFVLRWQPTVAPRAPMTRTSRAVRRRLSAPRSAGVGQSDHRGWGLGYVTLAADALGANRIGPRPAGDGSMTAVFELGTQRLALPIAVVEAFRVVDATPGWETEQGCPSVGTPITLEIERVVREAATHPGQITGYGPWHARQVAERTWVALPPDGLSDRVRDVLAGVRHERAIWAAAAPYAQTIDGLAVLCGLASGMPFASYLMTPEAWQRVFPEATAAMGRPLPAPPIEMPALNATAAAWLAVHYGRGWDWHHGRLHLVLTASAADRPALQALGAEDGRLPIGADPTAEPRAPVLSSV